MMRLLVILSLVVSLPFSVHAQTFIDVHPTMWSYHYIEDLVGKGVIDDGYYFYPDRALNRAELVKIMVLATTGILDERLSGIPTFPDVAPHQWYYPYIETAVITGIIHGYPDGLFRPDARVNRAEAVKIIVSAFGIPKKLSPSPFRDYDHTEWFHIYVSSAYDKKIISGKVIQGKPVFHPSEFVLRSEMAKMVSQTLKESTYY